MRCSSGLLSASVGSRPCFCQRDPTVDHQTWTQRHSEEHDRAKGRDDLQSWKARFQRNCSQTFVYHRGQTSLLKCVVAQEIAKKQIQENIARIKKSSVCFRAKMHTSGSSIARKTLWWICSCNTSNKRKTLGILEITCLARMVHDTSGIVCVARTSEFVGTPPPPRQLRCRSC